jgi:hypothetical protein
MRVLSFAALDSPQGFGYTLALFSD